MFYTIAFVMGIFVAVKADVRELPVTVEQVEVKIYGEMNDGYFDDMLELFIKSSFNGDTEVSLKFIDTTGSGSEQVAIFQVDNYALHCYEFSDIQVEIWETDLIFNDKLVSYVTTDSALDGRKPSAREPNLDFDIHEQQQQQPQQQQPQQQQPQQQQSSRQQQFSRQKQQNVIDEDEHEKMDENENVVEVEQQIADHKEEADAKAQLSAEKQQPQQQTPDTPAKSTGTATLTKNSQAKLEKDGGEETKLSDTATTAQQQQQQQSSQKPEQQQQQQQSSQKPEQQQQPQQEQLSQQQPQQQQQSLQQQQQSLQQQPGTAISSRPPLNVAAGEVSVADLKAQIDALQAQVNLLLSATPKPSDKRFPPVKFLNYKDRKRVLITGGAGFVGSHLVDYLMREGHEVVALDNHFTGRKRNVEHWIGHPNFELVHHDIVNPFFIEVDQIYHLASPASPPHYMFNPVKTIKTNVLGSINMLGLARRTKSTILLASTSEVYGDPEIHPQPETYWGRVNPVGPRSCYDEGKRVSESLFVAYEKQEQVQIRIARIFNTFGPRMHMNDGRVVSNFILQSLQNQNVTVYGTGKQTRSFQYVSDLVAGLVALMNSNVTTPVNLGNPEEHTMDEFAGIIKNLTNSTSQLVHIASPVDDPQQRRPDIRKADKFLGWKPQVSMVNGLKKTIAYFSAELKRNKMYEGASAIEGRLPIEHFEADTLTGM